jgi:hypothetical protein
MIVFTSSGYNMYTLMVLQLYNLDIDWVFMSVWCPFHVIGEKHISIALLLADLRWNSAHKAVQAIHGLAQKRKRSGSDGGSLGGSDGGSHGGSHGGSPYMEQVLLSSMCGEPMAPCECKHVFPRAAEVWTPPDTLHCRLPDAPWSEGWFCRWSHEASEYVPTYCFMREMRLQYMHHMNIEERKCASGRLLRWNRRLWLLTARRALRLYLSHKADLVDRVMSY